MSSFVLVDVGCIECGEQTHVVGIYTDEAAAQAATEAYVTAQGIEQWQPRGGFLEVVPGTNGEQTYLAGCGYFTKGQRAIELHKVDE